MQLDVFQADPQGGLPDMVTDSKGHQHYPTLYQHLECWEDWRDRTTEAWQDRMPVDGNNPVYVCTVCTSLIGSSELFMGATLGEFHNRPNTPFIANGVPKLACTLCIAEEEEAFPGWEELRDMDVTQIMNEDEGDDDNDNG